MARVATRATRAKDKASAADRPRRSKTAALRDPPSDSANAPEEDFSDDEYREGSAASSTVDSEESAAHSRSNSASLGPAAGAGLPPTYLESPLSFLRTYPVTHNEVGVLTIEPYKSTLLPQWRFKTPGLAQSSAETLFQKFQEYGKQRDFVGMDMARKFIQMGMTRAKRYANYKGGRKYERAQNGKGEFKGRDGKVRGKHLEKSAYHEGKAEKEQASQIFRKYWGRCKRDERYADLKEEFLKERRLEDREGKRE